MDERRHYHRYLLHTEIEYEDISSNELKLSTTKDISRGGICITTEGESLKKDSHYRLKFLLPFSDEEVTATAQVKWTRRDGNLFDNGLLFDSIEAPFLDLIENFSIGSIEEQQR
jgi:hypothetical protein